MDFTESADEELLEPLIITEDGDTSEGAAAAAGGPDGASESHSEELALDKKEETPGGGGSEEAAAGKMDSGERRSGQSITEEEHEPEGRRDEEQTADDGERGEKPRDVTSNEPPSEAAGETVPPSEAAGETVPPSEAAGETVPQEEQRVETSKQQPKGPERHEDDAKKAHRLTPDFPEALFELLCTFQEGRRLNDQRCSFSLEEGMRRRRCHSEPNTRKPINRVVFSSMTSLQKEEFFNFVATAQARRLDDQRAHLGRAAPAKPKCRSLRGSLRQLSMVKRPEPVPAPVPKDDLYDMIRTTQAQGRLEDQRSRAPGPMDDDDFFSLLLRVQGGRMDEQRTELPCLLQT